MWLFKKSSNSTYWDNMAKKYLTKEFEDCCRFQELPAPLVDKETFVAERVKLTREVLRIERLISSPLRYPDDDYYTTRPFFSLKRQRRSVKRFVTFLFATYEFWMCGEEELAANRAAKKKFLKKLQKGMNKLRKQLDGDLKRNDHDLEELSTNLALKMMRLQMETEDIVENGRIVRESYTYQRLE